MQRWPLRQVAFIGLGLIGSSLARLMRERGLVERITAASRSSQTLATAQQLGIIDIGYSNPADAVRGADLVILAMPVNATEAVMAAIKSTLSSSAVITDVG
ncbi:MAG: prephenate dehydrogenase/arogenate dehydrogenase family protein, partial [Paraperlucidibaca sp.]